MLIELRDIRFCSVSVTDYTEWIFAEVFDTEGARATVELTPDAASTLSEMFASLKGRAVEDEADIPSMLGVDAARLREDRPTATAVSAVRTAVVELRCQHAGVNMTEFLGGTPQESVPLYANVNRTLLGRRTAGDFAEAAARAVRDGYGIIKCAPFDELSPAVTADDIMREARPGLERVKAVRSAIGPDVRLLVDCHSRLNVNTAPVVAHELDQLDVGWFEEPLAPTRDAEGLALVAKRVNMDVAGGESGYGEDFFEELLARGAAEIIMPDVQYCGGVAEAYRAAHKAAQSGHGVSLHSPSGPVSQLAGAHVTAAVPGALPLEHAVHEAPWRAELLSPPERIAGGRLWFPGGPGLGASLNHAVTSRYGRRWRG